MDPWGANGLGTGSEGVWMHNCSDDAHWQLVASRQGAVVVLDLLRLRLRLLFSDGVFGVVDVIVVVVAPRILKEDVGAPSACM